MPKQLPQGIRARREALGITREALAYRSEISVRTLARVETEGHVPNARILGRIAAELGATTDDLLRETQVVA